MLIFNCFPFGWPIVYWQTISISTLPILACLFVRYTVNHKMKVVEMNVLSDMAGHFCDITGGLPWYHRRSVHSSRYFATILKTNLLRHLKNLNMTKPVALSVACLSLQQSSSSIDGSSIAPHILTKKTLGVVLLYEPEDSVSESETAWKPLFVSLITE